MPTYPNLLRVSEVNMAAPDFIRLIIVPAMSVTRSWSRAKWIFWVALSLTFSPPVPPRAAWRWGPDGSWRGSCWLLEGGPADS